LNVGVYNSASKCELTDHYMSPMCCSTHNAFVGVYLRVFRLSFPIDLPLFVLSSTIFCCLVLTSSLAKMLAEIQLFKLNQYCDFFCEVVLTIRHFIGQLQLETFRWLPQTRLVSVPRAKYVAQTLFKLRLSVKSVFLRCIDKPVLW